MRTHASTRARTHGGGEHDGSGEHGGGDENGGGGWLGGSGGGGTWGGGWRARVRVCVRLCCRGSVREAGPGGVRMHGVMKVQIPRLTCGPPAQRRATILTMARRITRHWVGRVTRQTCIRLSRTDLQEGRIGAA